MWEEENFIFKGRKLFDILTQMKIYSSSSCSILSILLWPYVACLVYVTKFPYSSYGLPFAFSSTSGISVQQASQQWKSNINLIKVRKCFSDSLSLSLSSFFRLQLLLISSFSSSSYSMEKKKKTKKWVRRTIKTISRES